MDTKHFDLCVIGGGINGAGIARDASMRGLSVLLLEAQDLANETSSASSKLVHGGLRYLEHYEFKLVRESLKEREKLLTIAPHIIWPMKFVLPHDQNQRPAWLIRLGLILYDNLARRKILEGSKGIRFKKHKYGEPLRDEFKKGFVYSDCWVDDARLVVLNAVDAQKHGAKILTNTACTQIKHDHTHWTLHTKNLSTGRQLQYTSDKVINAAGPWVRALLDESGLAKNSTPFIRLVKGSHIIVPKLHDGDQAYILQQPDGRIVFATPYEGKYTLVGTTDVEIDEDPSGISISEEEIEYLCNAANDAFDKMTTADDVISSYSGVRPLLDDGDEDASSVTRDYKLILDEHDDLKILSVFGGKITTYRTLSRDAVDKIYADDKDIKSSSTHKHPLPGGDIENAEFDKFVTKQKQRYPWLGYELTYRLARAYGTCMKDILDGANNLEGLGEHFGEGIYEAEINYVFENEFARTTEDFLWRRSKLGLHINDDTKQALDLFIKQL